MFTITGLKYRSILDIQSLTIDRPVSCLTGPSGSGKTTLLRCLNRLCEPDEGVILYSGMDIARTDPVMLRRQIVMLGQNPVLYDGTVEDNLQIGLRFAQKPAASRAQLLEALAKVGLQKSPDEGCQTLSGGERQRLCLARVLLMDAKVYLLDEPSSALDKETERFVIENLASFVRERDKELILVTHSPEVAGMYPGAQIRLSGGRTEGYADEQ